MQHIPCSRHVLINKCVDHAGLSTNQKQQFYAFAEILNAYIHFVTQSKLEQMKQAYSHFNPNLEIPVYPKLNEEDKKLQAEILAETFSSTLRDANFHQLQQKDIEKAFSAFSLVPVNTKVELNDYKQVKMFYRGSSTKEVTVKRFFRKKKITFENYDRVAVLLHMKDQDYFDTKKNNKEKLNFIPGKVYLYLYKNIPHYDLELLFPNVKISMNLKDKLLLGVPALGAAIPMVIKVLPSIGLLIGAIALLVFGWNLGGKFDVDISDAKAVYPLLVAVLSTSLALGGFAVRQYVKYKSKRLEFLKKVTDVLFFKSLDICQGTLNAIVDTAEEEQSKEAILIYALMLAEDHSFNQERVQKMVNAWVEREFSVNTDIDVHRSLQQLQDLSARMPNGEEKALVEKLSDGDFQACDIETAKYILDYIWDHAFQYANPVTQ